MRFHLYSLRPKKDYCIFSSPCWNNWTVVNGFEYVYDGTIRFYWSMVSPKLSSLTTHVYLIWNWQLTLYFIANRSNKMMQKTSLCHFHASIINEMKTGSKTMHYCFIIASQLICVKSCIQYKICLFNMSTSIIFWMCTLYNLTLAYLGFHIHHHAHHKYFIDWIWISCYIVTIAIFLFSSE